MLAWTRFEIDGLAMIAQAGEQGLRLLYLRPDETHLESLRSSDSGCEDSRHPTLISTRLQLEEYFLGRRTVFDLPLDPQGTPFQLRVWRALLEIPYGETRSYKELAVAIGDPGAIRAVGAANGRNPLPIVVPCHRVIGADGGLRGYGGGLPIKEKLLRLEGSFPESAPAPSQLSLALGPQ